MASVIFSPVNDMSQMCIHCGTKSKQIPLLFEQHQVIKILSKLDELKVKEFESFDYFAMIVASCAEIVMKCGMHR
jgi:hypothetical protein